MPTGRSSLYRWGYWPCAVWCRVRGGLRGARRIFASRNDRWRGPGAARWRLLTCPGRRPIRRVQVRRVGVASGGGGRIESCVYDDYNDDDDRRGDGTAKTTVAAVAYTRANGRRERSRARARQNSADSRVLLCIIGRVCVCVLRVYFLRARTLSVQLPVL